MNLSGSTPVPNLLFDIFLKELKVAELKVLLVIIRQTLGWSDSRSLRGRKEKDWISTSQLMTKTGNSRRAISSAIDTLVQKELIEVLDTQGTLLTNPSNRKGKVHLFYRLSPTLLAPVDNVCISSGYSPNFSSTNAKIAQDIRKNVTGLAQKMHITKETLQN